MKKCTIFILVCLLLTTHFTIASAQVGTSETAAKVKTAVFKRGTGENKRVKVKRLDGTKLKGYVSQAGEDSFTVIDSTTKQPVVIAYRDVEKVSNRSSRGDKIALVAIGAAAATTAAIVLGFLLIRCRNEGGC